MVRQLGATRAALLYQIRFIAYGKRGGLEGWQSLQEHPFHNSLSEFRINRKERKARKVDIIFAFLASFAVQNAVRVWAACSHVREIRQEMRCIG
jgi:hypothetical protein